MLKHLVAAIALTLCSVAAQATQYKWEVVRVIDGDTVVVKAKWLIPELGDHISVRVLGVDTPEKGARAKCEKEATLSEAAAVYVKTIIRPGDIVTVTPKGFDKYGGRILGTIDVLNRGDLSKILIDNNYARPYYGKTKHSWCN